MFKLYCFKHLQKWVNCHSKVYGNHPASKPIGKSIEEDEASWIKT